MHTFYSVINVQQDLGSSLQTQMHKTTEKLLLLQIRVCELGLHFTHPFPLPVSQKVRVHGRCCFVENNRISVSQDFL